MTVSMLAPRLCDSRTVVPKPQLVLGYIEKEWEVLRPELEQLYVHKRWKLRHLMQYMESNYGFKATEQMYKKRFAKWGFMKNSKRSTAALSTGKPKIECKRIANKLTSQVKEMVSISNVPGLCLPEELILSLLNTVRIWSLAFFESAHCREEFMDIPPLPAIKERASNIKRFSFALKLAMDLLDRGHGILAGRMVRKGFLLAEQILVLDGPALMWNLLEIMHHMMTQGHMQLFHTLLAHFSALADGHMAENHPLRAFLRGLRAFVGTMAAIDPWNHPKSLVPLLERVWILNAEILFAHFDIRLFQFYCHVLWESCSIGPPASIVFQRMEIQHVITVAETMVCETDFPTTPKEADWKIQPDLTPRVDASPPRDLEMIRMSSIAKLRQYGKVLVNQGASYRGDTAVLLPLLASLTTVLRLENFPGPLQSRMDAGRLACMISALVDLDIKQAGGSLGALLNSVEQLRALVDLRVHCDGEEDPHVVRDMWLLQEALMVAGEHNEAQEVQRKAYLRIEKCVADIPVDSA
ncbi:hypothetical protein BCR34DRAFT_608269 [Clohesyomyces aquaticus]|uniref:Clr5 domain-containing protein n=1 Tax=Clohesyomyces aquaticus TaxID=1231657 RepID=A0A1Y1Y8T1_9PLEO|nr:hypothetical protein BCR34DRAFT_608269 [Clohesyomyces aquaticus]